MKFKAGAAQFHINALNLIVPVVMIATGLITEYIIAFISVMLHEISHIAAATAYGVRPSTITITPVGFSAVIDDTGLQRSAMLKIYIAGPAANLAVSVISFLTANIFPHMAIQLKFLAMTNLVIAVFNLLPAYPLDGGKALQALLSGSIGILASGRVARRMAWFISAVMVTAGAYQLYITGYNGSLLIIGLYIPIILRTGRMESAIMNIKQILYRHTRLIKKGVYPARDLVVTKRAMLGETLKNMDFDRFHIIYVLDDDLRLIKVFTEAEIIDALTKGGDNVTFEQFIAGQTGSKRFKA